jgi:hypothetical protein
MLIATGGFVSERKKIWRVAMAPDNMPRMLPSTRKRVASLLGWICIVYASLTALYILLIIFTPNPFGFADVDWSSLPIYLTPSIWLVTHKMLWIPPAILFATLPGIVWFSRESRGKKSERWFMAYVAMMLLLSFLWIAPNLHLLLSGGSWYHVNDDGLIVAIAFSEILLLPAYFGSCLIRRTNNEIPSPSR